MGLYQQVSLATSNENYMQAGDGVKTTWTFKQNLSCFSSNVSCYHSHLFLFLGLSWVWVNELACNIVLEPRLSTDHVIPLGFRIVNWASEIPLEENQGCMPGDRRQVKPQVWRRLRIHRLSCSPVTGKPGEVTTCMHSRQWTCVYLLTSWELSMCRLCSQAAGGKHISEVE